MELLTLFITSFIVGFSGAMMPGPLLAVTIAETPRRGFQTGPILTGGHALAEIAVVVVLSLGLAALADNETISRGIAVIGGAMLIFMGLGMTAQLLKKYSDETAKSGSAKKSGRLVLDGIITSLSNPYWFVWWATTGSAFLVKSLKFGAVGPTVFYFGHILSDLVWYSFVSFIIWKGRKFVTGIGYKILIGICALFLIYLGGSFIYDGIFGMI
ncbi:MAG: lysine transporter LysE [Candidatus Zixiibacteriota bacterium]|nr:MAG: lysine transporter LysE [candidate division Zixibacteria bacterium]HHI03698.1 lysine transporter LysE [candidate division Zixibacteria bacterium]